MPGKILGALKGRLLPPSSRSFHTFAADISTRIAGIEARQVEALGYLRDAVGRQHEIVDRLARLEEEARSAKIRDAHARIYLEAIHRREGEAHDEARRRMFASIPPATGSMRLYQNANARLMSELDRICGELGIEYWFAYGTLVATLSRDGFIPWDDDIDICMLRDDIERLRAHLEGDPDFQVSVVYDRYVLCKQVRFSATDARIPCFIDLSIWDYAVDASKPHDDALRQMRLDLMSELTRIDGYAGYWAENPYLYEPGSGEVVQCGPASPDDQDPVAAAKVIASIEEVLARYQSDARERGIYCDAPQAGAVAYALENIYDAPWRRILWEKDMMLPPRRHAFERYEFCVPNRAEDVAEECYPGYPFLPNDMFTHNHFQRESLDDPAIQEALRRFALPDEPSDPNLLQAGGNRAAF